MRVGWTTGLLALLLLCSAGAQAAQWTAEETGAGAVLSLDAEDTDAQLTLPDLAAPDPDPHNLSNSSHPPAQQEPDAERAAEETQKSVVVVQTRIEHEITHVADQIGVARIQEEVRHAVEDTHESLPFYHETQQADPQDEDDPAPEPQSSVTEAFPEVAPPVLWAAGTAAGFGLMFWFAGSSASVGAGAAGTAAAARESRRFLPYASPLFTRFEKDTVLGHPKREAIYGQIVQKPGVTLQDLCDESGLSRTAVSHHLRLLEQQHLIISKRVGRSRHFFENGGRFGRDQKDAYAVLHNDRSKDIHAYIEENPGAIQKDLCRALDIQASVAHWHVKRLREANLIEAIRQGRTVSYFPAQCLQRPPAFA